MEKWENNRAWFLVLPAFVIVAFSAIIPLMTVVNYSIQDILPGSKDAYYVGFDWFKEMLANYRLHDALVRQFLFSGLTLLIEIPLGIMIALAMPKRGWGVSASLVILAMPLVIPCHRVVPKTNGTGGYRWGAERKRKLLAMEKQKGLSQSAASFK